jgi:hypothetical protein
MEVEWLSRKVGSRRGFHGSAGYGKMAKDLGSFVYDMNVRVRLSVVGSRELNIHFSRLSAVLW